MLQQYSSVKTEKKKIFSEVSSSLINAIIEGYKSISYTIQAIKYLMDCEWHVIKLGIKYCNLYLNVVQT